MDMRQQWSQQQPELRRLLHVKGQWDNDLPLFLHQHAILHSATMEPKGEWSYEDVVLAGLTEDQMRLKPGEGMNSIVWLIWHMARTEDATMNLLVAGRPQVLDDANWLEQLKLTRRDIGTSMGDEEVAEISAHLHIAVVRAYRVAVGRRTREIVRGLQATELAERVDANRIQKLLAAGALAEGAYALAQFWGGKKKADILARPVTRHSFAHLNETGLVRKKLGFGNLNWR